MTTICQNLSTHFFSSLRIITLAPSMFTTSFVLTFSLLLSLPLLFLFAPRFFPPPTSLPIPTSDELDDLSLFTRAISASSSRAHISSSKGRTLKIAFLFLTNTDLYFSPLWETFFSKGNNGHLFNVYVHADPSCNVTRPKDGAFKDRFIDHAKRTYRASPTLISATRRLLATAILDDPGNAFFALLSQHCIPLHSFSYVYHALFTSPTFDRSTDPVESTRRGVRVQYKSFIEIIAKDPQLWKRYVARGRYALLPEVKFDDFRVGSHFFVLTRQHALMVIEDRALWRKFKIPCYRADHCYPEEHYFPTLLSMRDPERCTGYTLTQVNWTGTVNGHPYTYRPNEVYPELIWGLRVSNYSSSYLFARKFSPDCLRPLMQIADSVIFQD